MHAFWRLSCSDYTSYRFSYNGKDSKVKSFCTVSESMDHSPAAVWAYLSPVLDEMQRENESLETLHIFSDGPVTQYKQKGNFYLNLLKEELSMPPRISMSLDMAKEPQMGLVGFLKGLLMPKFSNDIPDTKSFLQTLQNENLNISLYYVPPPKKRISM